MIVIMGVSGCGKSTVGANLAEKLSLPFMDADDYHPQANVEKMSNGIPLDDQDRWPWFDVLARTMNAKTQADGGVVCGCSALKRTYRTFLEEALDRPVLFVYLHGDRDLLVERMNARKDHYMPVSLLDSQLNTLEAPTADEPAITVSIAQDVPDIMAEILSSLQAKPA